MKQFFKFMFASMLGFLLTMLIMGIFFFMLIASLVALTGKEEVSVKSNSVLLLTLEDPVPERSSENPINFNPVSFNFKKNIPGLLQTIDLIDQAATDDDISGIYLDLSQVGSGMATLEEVRNALLKFKESGKFIYSYSEMYSQKAYYLATVSDQICLNPEGMLDFRGIIFIQH